MGTLATEIIARVTSGLVLIGVSYGVISRHQRLRAIESEERFMYALKTLKQEQTSQYFGDSLDQKIMALKNNERGRLQGCMDSVTQELRQQQDENARTKRESATDEVFQVREQREVAREEREQEREKREAARAAADSKRQERQEAREQQVVELERHRQVQDVEMQRTNVVLERALDALEELLCKDASGAERSKQEFQNDRASNAYQKAFEHLLEARKSSRGKQVNEEAKPLPDDNSNLQNVVLLSETIPSRAVSSSNAAKKAPSLWARVKTGFTSRNCE